MAHLRTLILFLLLQTKNIYNTLDRTIIKDLDRQIGILANCKGERECTITAGRRPDIVSGDFLLFWYFDAPYIIFCLILQLMDTLLRYGT